MKIILNILIISLLFVSCTKEIEIDIPGYEEQLVVDGRIETGQPPFILLSKSKDIYAPTDINSFMNSFVTGAIITISNGTTIVQLTEMCTDNLPPGSEEYVANLLGVSVANLSNYTICGYTSLDQNIWGEIGKTYDLNIQLEGKTYTSSTTIVPPTPLDAVFWKPDGDLTTHGYFWATVSDPPGQYDAYKWEIKRINLGTDNQPLDATFIEPFGPVSDDKFFDGITFDFFIENPGAHEDEIEPEHRGLYPLGDTVVIKFSKMDKAVYEFMEKKYTQLATAGNPFATPTNIPNNITGGALGIWAGYSPVYDTLICLP